MASLTIRKLDESVKAYLRLRSASNGRSVEEEVRVILGELIQGQELGQGMGHEPGHGPGQEPGLAAPPVQAPARIARPASATGEVRVTLIIGGGIAAYKALDLIRRLKERHIRVRCVLTKAATQFVTPLAASALSGERAYTEIGRAHV